MSTGQAKTIFEGSVVGFMEKVKNGTAIMRAKRQVSKDGVESKRGVVNVFEEINGVEKKIYFPIPSANKKYIQSCKAVVLALDSSSLESDEPTEEALAIQEHEELFEMMRDRVCKLLGKDPELYPVSFQNYSEEYKSWSMWLQTPESTRETNDPWIWSAYEASEGVATYCVNGIELVEPKDGAREQQKDRKAVFYFSLGKYKFNAEKQARVSKRKADREAGLLEPVQTINKKELSAKAMEVLAARRKAIQDGEYDTKKTTRASKAAKVELPATPEA